MTILEKPAAYDAFLRVLDETWQAIPLPIFATVLMRLKSFPVPSDEHVLPLLQDVERNPRRAQLVEGAEA